MIVALGTCRCLATHQRTHKRVRVLITGVAGFVGRHLVRHLLDTQPTIDLHGTALDSPSPLVPGDVAQHVLDLRDAEATRTFVERLAPDHIYHVAAQASVRRSFDAAWETLENNIRGQLNIIHGALSMRVPPRILVVSSGEIYGDAAPEHLPSDETTPLRPSSPYSVSKVTQDMLGLQYFLSHNLPILRARPFNHLGAGQSEGFVAPDFAMQIARVEAGQQEPRLYVGTLTAERDFTDVRDVVRAYRLIMEQGTPGDVYNVASGITHTIQEMLDLFLRHSTAQIEICLDPDRIRPASIPILWGDSSRLTALTGWQPTISFEQTLIDVLDDCRQRVSRVT